MKILVADDQKATRQLYNAILDHYDCQIIEATTGRETLERVAIDRPDLIILDHNMPELTGYEVVMELHKNTDFKKIPIVFVTGKNFDEGFQDLLKLEVAQFVAKPFDIDAFLLAIEKALKHPLSPKLK